MSFDDFSCVELLQALAESAGKGAELVPATIQDATDVAAALHTWMRARKAVTCWGSVEVVMNRRPAADEQGS